MVRISWVNFIEWIEEYKKVKRREKQVFILVSFVRQQQQQERY